MQKDPEQIARALVGQVCRVQALKEGTQEFLVGAFTQVIREGTPHEEKILIGDTPHEPRIVSDEELEKLSLDANGYSHGLSETWREGFRKAEELRATRDVEAAWPSAGAITQWVAIMIEKQGIRPNEAMTGSWLKSELLARLGGNKK